MEKVWSYRPLYGGPYRGKVWSYRPLYAGPYWGKVGYYRPFYVKKFGGKGIVLCLNLCRAALGKEYIPIDCSMQGNVRCYRPLYARPYRGKSTQGTHSNFIFEFLVFPCVFPVCLQIFPMPIYIICEYNIHRTDLADLSSFWKKMDFFAATIAISFTFRIRTFTT